LGFGTFDEVCFLVFGVPNAKNFVFGTPNANAQSTFEICLIRVSITVMLNFLAFSI